MMNLIKKIVYGCLILLIFLSCLIAFFLSTTPGLFTVIKLSKLYLPGTLHVSHLEGRLIDKFTIGEIDYDLNDIHIKMSHVTMDWHLLSLLHHQLPINNLNADVMEIKQNNSIYTLDTITLTGLANSQFLKLDSFQFNFLHQVIYGQMQFNLQAPNALSGKIKFNPFTKDQNLLTGAIDIGGDLNQIQWTGDIHGPGDISITGTLKQLTTIYQIIKWYNFKWQKSENNIINSPEGRIKLSGNLPNLNLELTSKINKSPQENWQLNGIIQGVLPWQWNIDMHLIQPLSPTSKHEGLYTSISAKGVLKNQKQGNLVLTVSPGHYQLAKDSPISALAFNGGTLNVLLSEKKMSGTGSLIIDQNKKLNLLFNLPKFNLSEGLLNTQPINTNLSLDVASFNFLQGISPEISNPKGHLTASLITKGTLQQSTIESKVTLSEASVTLPKLGLNLNSINITLTGKEKHWETSGSISSENKKLLVKGQGTFNSELAGDLTLQGSDFLIMNTREYQINVSPQLNLHFTPTLLNISGTILVPSAQIKPHTFNNSLALSDDVVFKNKEKTVPSLFNTTMDLKVEMGEAVELTFKGLHATLAGIVGVTQIPQGPVNANGELSVKKGEYKAYGQDLDIDQGQLIFSGGRLDNPGINLRASKNIDNSSTTASGTNQLFDFNNSSTMQNVNLGSKINVGVEVTGRLTDPKIQLFSNPSILSQADILSMLVLGRPASQANKAGGQLLLAAISSMNLGSGTNGAQLLEQLKSNLGFDLNVQTTSNYNQQTNQINDTTALVVGKSISKRIYVSYNVGLSQSDPNVLTLKYLLTKFLSIQVSNSVTGSGIDFLYTSSK